MRFVVLLAVSSLACNAADDPFCDSLDNYRGLGTSTQAIESSTTVSQGVRLQGVRLQGVRLQGVRLQGVRLQGVRLQGVRLQGVRLQGTELVGVGFDGQDLEGEELVGAVLEGILSDGSTLSLEIADASRDGELMRYTLEANGQSICEGQLGGIFVPGSWDESGAHHTSIDIAGRVVDTSFSCPIGVVAKCVTWGYAGGSDAHQACTRMARADYCGTGVPYTRDGTEIDIVDSLGIQTASSPAGFSFEAGWGRDGAVCANRARYQHVVDGTPVMPVCWSALPACSSWSEAAESGALTGNSSEPTVEHHSCQ